MFNYANDINIYREYANIVMKNHFEADVTRPYFCAYISRRNNREYIHQHSDIMTRYAGNIAHHEQIPGAFSAALGDYGYLIRSPYFEEIKQMAEWILDKNT